jgi:inosine-uridine nucleoside N-ribohydrolase
MGVPNCDVDDGLTLLYLLGRNDINLLGVTTTYGNNNIDTVYQNTKQMFKELNITEIPLYKGAGRAENRESEAAQFLVDIVKKHPGEIILLATGSLTNLYGAYELDNNFFSNLKEIVLMGGITKPLIINGKNLSELNFSCDPEATYEVLNSKTKVTILTGHICLQAFFGEKEFDRLIKNEDIKVYNYIKEKSLPWFNYIMNEFGIKGFYNWDIVAALYITNPELFDKDYTKVISTVEDLKTGLLKLDDSTGNVNIPKKIKDIDRFNEIIFDTWKNFDLNFS